MMLDARPVPRSRRVAPYIPIVLLGSVAAAVLMFLGRSMTFWQDEWGSITFSGGLIDLIRPVNEHWSTFPLLLYRATFGVVGLHSYLPYLAEVIALHLIAVAAAFFLIRHRAGTVVATVACVPLLFLGSGSENLFWAFQTGFVGSVAFGSWALVMLDRRGRGPVIGAALLLIAALMSSGMGLFFLVAGAGRTLLDPAARRRALAIIPPAVVYAVWYVTVGQGSVDRHGHLAGLVEVAAFIVRGIGHAIGAFTGLGRLPLGDSLSVILFAIFAVATVWAVLRSHRPPALAAGSLFAIAVMYTIIGTVRADLPADFATRSRYVYVAAFFLMLSAADWLPLLRDWAKGRRVGSVTLVAVVSVAVLVVTVVNLAAFGPIRSQFQAHANLTRAYIELALTRGGEDWIDPGSRPLRIPPLPVLIATVERFGSPLHDSLVPAVARDPGAKGREAALLWMVGGGFSALPAVGGQTPTHLPVVNQADVTIVADGACLIPMRAGPDARVTILVPTGTRVRIDSSTDVRLSAQLGLTQPPSKAIDFDVAANHPVDLSVPDIGDASVWTVRLDLPEGVGAIRICGA